MHRACGRITGFPRTSTCPQPAKLSPALDSRPFGTTPCCVGSAQGIRSGGDNPSMTWLGHLAPALHALEGRAKPARWTATRARCACCAACTRRARAFATTCWCTRPGGHRAGGDRAGGGGHAWTAGSARAADHARGDALLPQRRRPWRCSARGLRLADGRAGWNGCRWRRLAYRGCRAENHLRLRAGAGRGDALGWDLRLPWACRPRANHWDDGDFLQHLELPGVLARARRGCAGRITALLQSARWAGPGTACWARCGAPPGRLLEPPRPRGPGGGGPRGQRGQPSSRSCHGRQPPAPDGRVVVLRVLADSGGAGDGAAGRRCVGAVASGRLWQLAPEPPRVWRT
jgi:hypothetical protein